MKRRQFFKKAGAMLGGTVCGSRVFDLQAKHSRNDRPPKRPEPKKIIVFSPHYTWYTYESWLKYPNERAYTTPIRALYDSGDSHVAADQNDEKKEYGIGVDVVSWWGPGDASYNLFRKGYLEASNFEDRKFCFLYEITGRLREEDGFFNFDNPYNIEKYLDDIDYLERTYFHYKNYCKIDGRPVLYIWRSQIRNFDKVSKMTKDNVYLIGSVPIFFPPHIYNSTAINSLKWYDAITDYGIAPIYLAKKYGKITDECIKKYADAARSWNYIIQENNLSLELILPMQFAYQDNYGSIDPYDGGNRILEHDPVQSEKFARAVRLIAEELPTVKRVMLTSYNEHREGHGAEPSYEYGDLWLSLIQRFFKKNEPFIGRV